MILLEATMSTVVVRGCYRRIAMNPCLCGCVECDYNFGEGCDSGAKRYKARHV